MSDEFLTVLTRLARERSRLLTQEASLWAELSEALTRASVKTEPAPLPEATKPPSGTLLRVHQAADLLGLSAGTLDKWRVTGGGPEFIKLGRRILYRRETLEEFISGKMKPHTSAYSADTSVARQKLDHIAPTRRRSV
ncbi:MAG: helix-turn-helix domain-containing protein [Pirellulaceae bacterium]